ncbi:MAG: hypothetical protein JSV54_07365 [Chloroflexota bacterium]|nr:MAG: hypothetical protein JSV54_07365 [Chloroflexota bacterium]
MPTSTDTTTTEVPTIWVLDAYPPKTTVERPVILSWNVANANSIQIDQGVGSGLSASGAISVSPNSSTTYTLTASNSAGTATQSVTVTVVFLPEIVVFDISPDVLHWSKASRETAVMRWEVRNATTVKITEVRLVGPLEKVENIDSERPLEHSGSRTIHLSPDVIGLIVNQQIVYTDTKPLGTRTYILEATNADGTVTKTQTLEAVP